MSEVLFIPAPEAGHILPLLPVVRCLRQRGVSARFLVPAMAAPAVQRDGFEVETCYPTPSNPTQQVAYALGQTGRAAWCGEWEALATSRRVALEECYRQRMGEVIEGRNTSAIVVDRIFARRSWVTTALPRHIPLIYLSTSLLQRATNSELNHDRSIVLCPRAFASNRSNSFFDKVLFAEPSIDRQRAETAFDLGILRSGRPLVLCAFGSQSMRNPEVAGRLQCIRSAAGLMKDVDFIVASGISNKDPSKQGVQTAENVWEFVTFPQLTLLRHAALLLCHGGLGSVKESIFEGVPPVCWPLCFDQHYNAKRVERLGIGSRLAGAVSAEQAARRIVEVLGSAKVREKLLAMQSAFRHREADPVAARRIQEIAYA